jgi:hypothetical protein
VRIGAIVEQPGGGRRNVEPRHHLSAFPLVEAALQGLGGGDAETMAGGEERVPVPRQEAGRHVVRGHDHPPLRQPQEGGDEPVLIGQGRPRHAARDVSRVKGGTVGGTTEGDQRHAAASQRRDNALDRADVRVEENRGSQAHAASSHRRAHSSRQRSDQICEA